MQGFYCPLPPGSEAMHCKSSTAHYHQAVRQRIAGVALPSASKRGGSALHEPPLPTVPNHCGSA